MSFISRGGGEETIFVFPTIGGNPTRIVGTPRIVGVTKENRSDKGGSGDKGSLGFTPKKTKKLIFKHTHMNNSTNHNYYVYILTNKIKTVLYIGVTNNLKRRLQEHEGNVKSSDFNHSFTSRYNVRYLIYFERFQWIQHAIAREKELKGWRRSKKEALIATINPEWNFLNETVE